MNGGSGGRGLDAVSHDRLVQPEAALYAAPALESSAYDLDFFSNHQPSTPLTVHYALL